MKLIERGFSLYITVIAFFLERQIGMFVQNIERMLAKKVRIVERTHPSGRVEYVIQKRLYMWSVTWQWVDQNSFRTLEDAEKDLWRFDGSQPVDKVIVER